MTINPFGSLLIQSGPLFCTLIRFQSEFLCQEKQFRQDCLSTQKQLSSHIPLNVQF